MTLAASSFSGTLTLTFYVTKDGEEACLCRKRYLASGFRAVPKVEDDDLKSLGRSIMAACNDPQFHQHLSCTATCCSTVVARALLH